MTFRWCIAVFLLLAAPTSSVAQQAQENARVKELPAYFDELDPPNAASQRADAGSGGFPHPAEPGVDSFLDFSAESPFGTGPLEAGSLQITDRPQDDSRFPADGGVQLQALYAKLHGLGGGRGTILSIVAAGFLLVLCSLLPFKRKSRRHYRRSRSCGGVPRVEGLGQLVHSLQYKRDKRKDV